MRVKFLDELGYVLDKFKINRDEICLIGSSVLAFADIRENHDLDFAMSPDARNRILKLYHDQVQVLPSGTINFSSDIQSLYNRYAKIGLLDEEMFDDKYTVYLDGLRIAKLEVEIAQKLERDMEKDRKDFAKIRKDGHQFLGFDNELYEKLVNRKAIIFGAGAKAKLAYYCYSARYELLCYVDNNHELWGREINGLKVCPPDVLKDTDATIIISSQQYAAEIKRDLFAKLGKRKVITFSMKEELSILSEEQ
ncbi:hypothetical protein V1224_13100 [Lachnospiraceae bacterium JLR.KK008]